MRKLIFLLLPLLFSSCSTFEKSDLIGSWKTLKVHSEMNVGGFEGALFNFGPDDKFLLETSDGQLSGTYYWWGNTLHLVNEENIDWPISVQELNSSQLILELTRADIPATITLQKTD